ncbi:MAG TPA: hypothetical protein VHO06_07180 [Polyangia bacterium]|nr:hypothetical protein [Polyangia bacterium]
MSNRGARYLNILLGIWLFISAFVWPHRTWQFENTWILGVIAVVVGFIALGAPAIRFVNTVVGIWLVISGFGAPALSVATRWNNGLVGIAIFILSLVGSGSASELRTGRHVTSTT